MAEIKALTIIPVYNEKNHIGRLLDRIPSNVSALIVDDASADGTQDIITSRGLATVRHTERTGVGRCLQDGIRYALDHGYDTIVVMAGNGKDDPQEIPNVLAPIARGAEYVQGSRFLAGGAWNNLPRKRWLAIKSFTWVWSLCMRRRLTDVTNGFRAYRISFLRRPEVKWEQEWLRTYELEYYLHYWALKLRVPFEEIPVTKNYPTKTNYSKIRPGKDWIRIVKPLFLLMFHIKQ